MILRKIRRINNKALQTMKARKTKRIAKLKVQTNGKPKINRMKK